MTPSAEDGLWYHRRLCEGDPLAPSDVCKVYLPILLGWLHRCSPRADDHLRQTAAQDALIDWILHPERFDPRRGDLVGWLRMAARRNLANLERGEARHQRQRDSESSVELDQLPGNTSGRDDPVLRLIRDEEVQELDSAVLTWSEEERRVLALMRQGEKSTEVFARVLGLEAQPPEQQAHEVKKVKDRITRRLQRRGENHA